MNSATNSTVNISVTGCSTGWLSLPFRISLRLSTNYITAGRIADNHIQKLALEEKYVLLAEVPVSEPWQLLAWFPFSYYNDCPDNKTLANVGKYWFEQYGAVPTFIAHNMLGMTVPQPVSDAQSLNLAKEQYAFCPNRFEVSYIQTILQPIHALADSLRKSTVWKFRWEY